MKIEDIFKYNMENITDEDFYDIIAIRFGSIIRFSEAAIKELRQKENFDQLISRAEFKMMARFDLGDKWRECAERMPTLFLLNK